MRVLERKRLSFWAVSVKKSYNMTLDVLLRRFLFKSNHNYVKWETLKCQFHDYVILTLLQESPPPPPVFLQSTNSRFFFFSKFKHSRDVEKSYFTFTQRKKNRFCWLLRRLHPSLNLPKKILHNGIFAKSDQFYVLAWQSYSFWFLITDVFSRLY